MTTSQVIASIAIALSAAQAVQAQTPIKTNNTYGGAYIVTQSDVAVTGRGYDTGAVTGVSTTDTLQTLYGAGNVTITYDATSTQKSLGDGTLSGFVDGTSGKLAGTANGANTPANNSNKAPTVFDFTFSAAGAPNGYTLSDLNLLRCKQVMATTTTTSILLTAGTASPSQSF